MFKVINSSTSLHKIPESIHQLAEKSVSHILTVKPGGVSAIEEQLELSNHWKDQLEKFKNDHKEFYIVGIGGSSLGVQVFAEVFQSQNFHFIDNVDASHFENLLLSVKDLKTAGWLFVSKSGKTIETLTALEVIQQHYLESSISLAEHSITITEEKKSDLYEWSVQNKVPIFPIPLSVGGRFSVLSAVGLVPAILMGLDLNQIKVGVHEAYSNEKILVQLTESVLQSFSRQEWITVLWSYSSRLKSFGLWWQQLWAESLAKRVNRNNQSANRVSTPLPLVGATDQHSVLQQIMEGAKDKFVIFLRVNTAENGKIKIKNPQLSETFILKNKNMGQLLKAEAEATQLALEKAGVSQISLQISDLSEKNVAFLFMFLQLLVMSLGEALNINTFDQPGVELGKVIAKKILIENKTVHLEI